MAKNPSLFIRRRHRFREKKKSGKKSREKKL